MPSRRFRLLLVAGSMLALAASLPPAAPPAQAAGPLAKHTRGAAGERKDMVVKSKRFGFIAGQFETPENQGFVVPSNWRKEVACAVRVEKNEQPAVGVKINLGAFVLDDGSVQLSIIVDTEKSDRDGFRFFQAEVPNNFEAVWAKWGADFKRKKIDYAGGWCEYRTYASCQPNDTTVCIRDRFATSLELDTGTGLEPAPVTGTSSGGGAQFDADGTTVEIDIRPQCLVGVHVVEISVSGGELSVPWAITVLDVASGEVDAYGGTELTSVEMTTSLDCP